MKIESGFSEKLLEKNAVEAKKEASKPLYLIRYE